MIKEQINNFRNSSSVEELMEKLEKENIKVSRQEAEKMFNAYCSEGQIEDEELENVTGGACYGDSVKSPHGDIHDYVVVTAGNSCPAVLSSTHTCANCGFHFWFEAREYCEIRWKGHEKLVYYKNGTGMEDGEKNW